MTSFRFLTSWIVFLAGWTVGCIIGAPRSIKALVLAAIAGTFALTGANVF